MDLHIKQPWLARLVIGILLITAFSSVAIAQNNITETLTGQWLFNEQASFAKIDAASRAHLDSLPQLKAQFELAYRGKKILFEADGDYGVLLADGRSAGGSWTLGSNNRILITDPMGKVYPHRLARLTATELILIPETEEGLKSMLTELHYIKL